MKLVMAQEKSSEVPFKDLKEGDAFQVNGEDGVFLKVRPWSKTYPSNCVYVEQFSPGDVRLCIRYCADDYKVTKLGEATLTVEAF